MRTVGAHRAFFLAVALAFSSGCKKDEIAVYRVPKEAPPAPMAPAMDGPMMAGAAGHGGLHWTVPKGWREQAASGMRAGSFQAPGAGGKDVDVSVVPLAGEAGGELANVNRWRGQLGLPPVDEAGIGTVVKSERIGPHTARLVDFSNNEGKRLLAVMLKNGPTTYFFKASGDDAAVKSIRPAFLSFVASVRFDAHE